MEITAATANAHTLHKEFEWFARLIEVRMKLYFGEDCEYSSIYDIVPPDTSNDTSMYAGFINYYKLHIPERIILLLSLCPHVKPQLLDVFLSENTHTRRGYTEFGGIRGNQHGGFIPTAETAAFLIAGKNLAERFDVYTYFGE